MWDTGALESAGLSSAGKSAVFAVVAFYDVTWDEAQEDKHERMLVNDLGTAIEYFIADLILLSECDEIDAWQKWLLMLRCMR